MLCSYDRKYCEGAVNLKKVEQIVSTCKRLDRLTFNHPDVGICIVPHTNTKRTRRGSGKLVLLEKNINILDNIEIFCYKHTIKYLSFNLSHKKKQLLV